MIHIGGESTLLFYHACTDHVPIVGYILQYETLLRLIPREFYIHLPSYVEFYYRKF